MVSITIRDIPEDVFELFREMAKDDRRSLNAEVIDVIEKAVQQRKLNAQRMRALEELDVIRKRQPPSYEEETQTILHKYRGR